MIELLRGYFAIESRDDPRKIREKVTGKVLTLAPALAPAVPAFLALLDVPVEEASWHALDPLQRRQQTLDAVKRLLLRESEVQPLVVVFEDLHWIDGGTQSVLDGLIESLPAARLLLLVNYRPEYAHAWGGKTYYRQLRIDPLPPESAEELLEALLGADAALGPLKQLLVEQTEAESPLPRGERAGSGGNGGPGRRTRRLSSHSAGRESEDSRHRPGHPGRAHRSPGARHQAAAPGRRRHRQGRGRPAAPGHCRRAGARGARRAHAPPGREFLYETRLFPDLEYTFKHALTHEVAYGGLLHERQRSLHARITEAIERLATERVAEQAERLAHHALRGELWDKAVVYLRQAGLRALTRAASREAIAHLEQALGAVRHLPETRHATEATIDVHIELRNALLQTGDRARMGEHLHAAEALARRLGDQRRLARIATFMVTQCLGTGDYDEAVRFGQEALSLGQSLADRSIEVVATSFLGMTRVTRGDFNEAAALFERNLALVGDSLTSASGHPSSRGRSRGRSSPTRSPSSAGSTRPSGTPRTR